jgi:hypothetical protein
VTSNAWQVGPRLTVAIGWPIELLSTLLMSGPAQKARTTFIAVPKTPLMAIASTMAHGTAVAAFVLREEQTRMSRFSSRNVVNLRLFADMHSGVKCTCTRTTLQFT